jgi:hypothetical protein
MLSTGGMTVSIDKLIFSTTKSAHESSFIIVAVSKLSKVLIVAVGKAWQLNNILIAYNKCRAPIDRV